MYAKARRGEIKGWTGIHYRYEMPESAEIVLDTIGNSAEKNARRILDHLAQLGFVRSAVASTARRSNGA